MRKQQASLFSAFRSKNIYDRLSRSRENRIYSKHFLEGWIYTIYGRNVRRVNSGSDSHVNTHNALLMYFKPQRRACFYKHPGVPHVVIEASSLERLDCDTQCPLENYPRRYRGNILQIDVHANRERCCSCWPKREVVVERGTTRVIGRRNGRVERKPRSAAHLCFHCGTRYGFGKGRRAQAAEIGKIRINRDRCRAGLRVGGRAG